MSDGAEDRDRLAAKFRHRQRYLRILYVSFELGVDLRFELLDAQAGRLSSLSVSFNVSPPALNSAGPGSQALLNITAHSPFGGLATATLGTGNSQLNETRNYDNRERLGSISLVNPSNNFTVYSLGLGYAGNGNVLSANDSQNSSWTYTYDGVNRLQTAVTTGQSFTYTPDAWGNMTCTNTGSLPCTPLGLGFNAATNQIADDGIHQYDPVGNLTQDGTHGYVYDAENRLTCVVGTDGTCTSASAKLYFYDAQGQRVGKQQADTLEDFGSLKKVTPNPANQTKPVLGQLADAHFTAMSLTGPSKPESRSGVLAWNGR